MSAGTVTVIMPALHAAATIVDAVDSVRDQDYADWELVIVADDLCDYASLLPRDPRLICLRTAKPRSGPAAARNVGLARGLQPFVTFLDSDDVWYRDKLSRLVPRAQEWGIALDNVRFRAASGQGPEGVYWDAPRAGHHEPSFLAAVSQSLWPVFRREVVGPLRFSEDLDFAEDAVFNLALIARNAGAYLHPQPLHEQRLRHDTLSRSVTAVRRAGDAYDRILAALQDGTDRSFAAAQRPWAMDVFRRRQALNQAFAMSEALWFEAFEVACRAAPDAAAG